MGQWVWQRIGKRVYQPMPTFTPEGMHTDDPRGFDLANSILELEEADRKGCILDDLKLWGDRKSKKTGEDIFKAIMKEYSAPDGMLNDKEMLARYAPTAMYQFAMETKAPLILMRRLLGSVKIPSTPELFSEEEKNDIVKRVANGNLDRERAISLYGSAVRDIIDADIQI